MHEVAAGPKAAASRPAEVQAAHSMHLASADLRSKVWAGVHHEQGLHG